MILHCGAELTMTAEGLTLDLTTLGTTKLVLSLADVSDLAGALIGGAHGMGRWAQLAGAQADAEAAAAAERETEVGDAAMS